MMIAIGLGFGYLCYWMGKMRGAEIALEHCRQVIEEYYDE